VYCTLEELATSGRQSIAGIAERVVFMSGQKSEGSQIQAMSKELKALQVCTPGSPG
jgi:hypothetical protein